MRTPDVVIVGAQKAATTGLLRTLAQHPAVTVPPPRGATDETTALHSGGAAWQEWVRREAPDLEELDPGQSLVVKLATAMYFADTLQAIQQLNPAVKVITLLRHPVDRMLSQYLYTVQHGLESRPADQALGEDRVQRPGHYRLRTYSEGSRYGSAIERIRTHFSPDQVLYLDFGSMRTGACLPLVEEFLGIEHVPWSRSVRTRAGLPAAPPRHERQRRQCSRRSPDGSSRRACGAGSTARSAPGTFRRRHLPRHWSRLSCASDCWSAMPSTSTPPRWCCRRSSPSGADDRQPTQVSAVNVMTPAVDDTSVTLA